MEGRDVDRNNVITRTNLGVVSSTADEMDERRRNTVVLDYLRKLDEAKAWIELHIKGSMELSTFIAELPKGEWLAEIAKSFDGDARERIYRSPVREYLHTDNINMFLTWLRKIKLSRHFYFEVIDLYESKNIPKVVYCIHGLAHYLNMKGISKGISRSKSVFSEADRALIGSDIGNIEEQCYDDIEERVQRMEDDRQSGRGSQDSSFVSPGLPDGFYRDLPEEARIIKSFARTYLWRASFRNLCSQERITIPLLKKFLTFDSKADAEEQRLLELNRQIFLKFKENFAMQEEKDGILRSARLLLENQSRLRQIEYNEFPLANDYRLFKRVMYNLLHDYDLLYRMLGDGYELPLRVFYPDNRIGDYHFAKFIEHVREKDEEAARKIAGKHFMSSMVFRKTIKIFSGGDYGAAAGANSRFNLSPLDVSKELYSDKTHDHLLSRKSLLDEAIKDRAVREEIVRRVDRIIRFVNDRMDYLRKISLPLYARVFVDHKTFFEDFLEPAILLSDNFIISEIVKYIFYSKKLFDGQTYFFEQERLTYYDCKVERTSSFDLADYSPLRDWLESDVYAGFYGEFVRKNELEDSVNELVLKEEGDECVEIEVCLEEVNNIIIVLKENVNIMSKVMGSMVSKMTLLRQQPSDVVRVAVSCCPEECAEKVDVMVNSRIEGGLSADEGSVAAESAVGAAASSSVDGAADSNGPSGVPCENNGRCLEARECDDAAVPPNSSTIVLGNMSDAKATINSHRCSHPQKTNYFEEKFILKLDTQFIDLEDDADFAITTVLNNLKTRIILLITISSENTLHSILNITPESETARYAALHYPVDSLLELKRSVLEDLEFLASKKIISSANSYQSVLEMIAYDFVRLRSRNSEYVLNCDTLDALFKKGVLLRKQLDSLYAYSSALLVKMAVNRSGTFFNRQCAPNSTYGSYKYSLSVLDPHLFEDLEVSNLKFVISMDEPLVFSISILHDDRVWDSFSDIRFDELLRLQEDKIPYFDVNGIMSLNVNKLVGIVNEQYVQY